MQTQEKNDKISVHEDMLLREYESLVSQIIHWDSHFWTKSQFFLVIESAFIAVVLQAFKEQIVAQSKLTPALVRICKSLQHLSMLRLVQNKPPQSRVPSTAL